MRVLQPSAQIEKSEGISFDGIANLLSPDRAERKLCLSGGHFGSVAFPEVECVGPGVAK
jgi:hypothetical protein